MKHFFLSSLLLLAAGLTQAQNLLDVKTFTLSNGMEVWINEDHSQPKAFGAVVVKAGARDCPGTGIAHYFEHIMFKGTEKIGTLDYAAEKPCLDSIAVLYDSLAVAPEEERAAIQKEINRLNIEASRYAVPNEFNNLITASGGSKLNAYTNYDVTVYHNEFVPAYLEQWAELYSERLINPVFRLFQGELETVYEEKNQRESNDISAFAEKITSEGFRGSPYQFPVIGTTENLKTPSLSKMAEFFDRYYVAGNIGLMLSGDIDADKALPILERSFGRVRKGDAERERVAQPSPFEGEQVVEAPVNIPLVNLSVLCFRGPSSKDPDCLPLSLVSFMLNNSEGTGLLDKLLTDKKLLAAVCMYPALAMEEAGLFPILIIPLPVVQSDKMAEEKVLSVLDGLKRGDFSDEFFESCKMTYRKSLLTRMESLGSRMDEMVNAFSEGRRWEEVLRESEVIDALSKEDIKSLAEKYFTGERLVIRKKYGHPEKDNLPKPPYDKISPEGNASSAYADAFRKKAGEVSFPPPSIDYEKDARQSEIGPLVHLYCVKNPLNDVFNLTISYPVGTNDFPSLKRVASYLSLIGTQSMDYETHRARMQALGGSMEFSADNNHFQVKISGFDKHFAETVALATDLLEHPKADLMKLYIIGVAGLTDKIALGRDLSELSSALVNYLRFGEESGYLKKEGKLSSKYLFSELRKCLEYECDIHYSGNLPEETVTSVMKTTLIPAHSQVAKPYYSCKQAKSPEEARVYFIPLKNSTQTRIYALVLGDCLTDLADRQTGSVASRYFGGDMNSVLFQEIREFRSLAYSANARLVLPDYEYRETVPVALLAGLGTQGDKTIDAVTVLDSLIHNLPLSETRFDGAVKSVMSGFVVNYPTFRTISQVIASSRRSGEEADYQSRCIDLLSQLSMDDLSAWWVREVEGRPIIWAIVGDPAKIDMEALGKFGPVTRLRPGDVMRLLP